MVFKWVHCPGPNLASHRRSKVVVNRTLLCSVAEIFLTNLLLSAETCLTVGSSVRRLLLIEGTCQIRMQACLCNANTLKFKQTVLCSFFKLCPAGELSLRQNSENSEMSGIRQAYFIKF